MRVNTVFKWMCCCLVFGSLWSCEQLSQTIRETLQEEDNKQQELVLSKEEAIEEEEKSTLNDTEKEVDTPTESDISNDREIAEVESDQSPTPEPEPEPEPKPKPKPKPKLPLTSDKKALEAAETALRNLPKFKGKEIRAYNSVYYYEDGRIMLGIIDPDHPDQVDTYIYKNGKWLPPEMVVITRRDDVEGSSVPLSRVSFVNANNVYQTLVEKAEEVGAIDVNYTFRVRIRGGQLRWYTPDLKTGRKAYAMMFNDNGTLKEFIEL